MQRDPQLLSYELFLGLSWVLTATNNSRQPILRHPEQPSEIDLIAKPFKNPKFQIHILHFFFTSQCATFCD